MIRSITPVDDDAIVELSHKSSLFSVEESEGIREMLAEYHELGIIQGEKFLVWEQQNQIVGMAYFAPKSFTDRVWELMMIAVDESFHRQGIGSKLLLAVEGNLRECKGRMLLIETSDKGSFKRTRQFYEKHKYRQVSLIPDYYAEGDGKVSFIKTL